MDNQRNGRRANDLEFFELKQEVTDLKQEVTELRADIKGLVEAWNTAKGMTSFVKWLSGLIISVGVVAALIKGGMK